MPPIGRANWRGGVLQSKTPSPIGKADWTSYLNVEMSLYPRQFEPFRLEYYAAKLLLVQSIKGDGKGYKDLKQAYQVSIFGNERFFGDDEFFHSFEYYDLERGVSLNGKTRIITLELSKLEPIAGKPIAEMGNREMWAVFFKHLTDPEMRETINVMMKREEGVPSAIGVWKLQWPES